MKTNAILAVSFATFGFAASLNAETYQVTGPVLELTDSKIVVQKEKEKWEIARTANTKVTGDLKVGAKVTIQYSMMATAVEVKTEKPAAVPAKPATAPAKPGAAPSKPTGFSVAPDESGKKPK